MPEQSFADPKNPSRVVTLTWDDELDSVDVSVGPDLLARIDDIESLRRSAQRGQLSDGSVLAVQIIADRTSYDDVFALSCNGESMWAVSPVVALPSVQAVGLKGLVGPMGPLMKGTAPTTLAVGGGFGPSGPNLDSDLRPHSMSRDIYQTRPARLDESSLTDKERKSLANARGWYKFNLLIAFAFAVLAAILGVVSANPLPFVWTVAGGAASAVWFGLLRASRGKYMRWVFAGSFLLTLLNALLFLGQWPVGILAIVVHLFALKHFAEAYTLATYLDGKRRPVDPVLAALAHRQHPTV